MVITGRGRNEIEVILCGFVRSRMLSPDKQRRDPRLPLSRAEGGQAQNGS